MNKYIKLSLHQNHIEYKSGELSYAVTMNNCEKSQSNECGWKYKENSFSCNTDAHGIYKIFYYLNGEKIIISNNLSDITNLINNMEINYSALAVFLRLGCFINNDTPFIKIKTLGPGGTLSINNGKIEISETHLWSKSAKNLKKEDAIEQYSQLFSSSMRCLKPHKICIPLSGGRDSRHIFLETKKQNIDIESLITTYFEPNNNFTSDVELASLLALREKENLDILKVKNNWLDREQLKDQLTDLSTLQHSWYVDLGKNIPENCIFLDGLGGDILSESKKLSSKIDQAFKKKSWDFLLDHYLGTEDKISSMLKANFAKKISYYKAREHLRPCLEKYSAYHNPQAAFEFYTRTIGCIAPASQKLVGNAKVYYPFLEKNLFEFLTSVPKKLFPENNFHSLVINKSYPKFSDIPYELSLTGSKPYPKIHQIHYNLKNYFGLFNLVAKAPTTNFLNKSTILPRLMLNIMNPFKLSKYRWMDSRIVYLVGLSNHITQIEEV